MAKIYVGSSGGVAVTPSNIYVGVNNVATQVKKMYCGDSNNQAVLIWSSPTRTNSSDKELSDK